MSNTTHRSLAGKRAIVTGSTLTIDGGIQLPWREMYRTKEKPDGSS